METIKYYNRLSETLGKETAEDIVNLVELQSAIEAKRRVETPMTKEDGNGIRVEMANVKSELTKWMFIFWIGQITVVVAVILAVFK